MLTFDNYCAIINLCDYPTVRKFALTCHKINKLCRKEIIKQKLDDYVNDIIEKLKTSPTKPGGYTYSQIVFKSNLVDHQFDVNYHLQGYSIKGTYFIQEKLHGQVYILDKFAKYTSPKIVPGNEPTIRRILKYLLSCGHIELN